jgi:hypothetical protein
LLAIFGRAGIDAATVVVIGMLFGPSQVIARIGELVFARGLHPLMVARFAVGFLLLAFALLALLGMSARRGKTADYRWAWSESLTGGWFYFLMMVQIMSICEHESNS